MSGYWSFRETDAVATQTTQQLPTALEMKHENHNSNPSHHQNKTVRFLVPDSGESDHGDIREDDRLCDPVLYVDEGNLGNGKCGEESESSNVDDTLCGGDGSMLEITPQKAHRYISSKDDGNINTNSESDSEYLSLYKEILASLSVGEERAKDAEEHPSPTASPVQEELVPLPWEGKAMIDSVISDIQRDWWNGHCEGESTAAHNPVLAVLEGGKRASPCSSVCEESPTAEEPPCEETVQEAKQFLNLLPNDLKPKDKKDKEKIHKKRTPTVPRSPTLRTASRRHTVAPEVKADALPAKKKESKHTVEPWSLRLKRETTVKEDKPVKSKGSKSVVSTEDGFLQRMERRAEERRLAREALRKAAKKKEKDDSVERPDNNKETDTTCVKRTEKFTRKPTNPHPMHVDPTVQPPAAQCRQVVPLPSARESETRRVRTVNIPQLPFAELAEMMLRDLHWALAEEHQLLHYGTPAHVIPRSYLSCGKDSQQMLKELNLLGVDYFVYKRCRSTFARWKKRTVEKQQERRDFLNFQYYYLNKATEILLEQESCGRQLIQHDEETHVTTYCVPVYHHLRQAQAQEMEERVRMGMLLRSCFSAWLGVVEDRKVQCRNELYKEFLKKKAEEVLHSLQ
ncbi:hypothetical protein AGDE_13334 [Angomonas deanei]|uniref:Uncharacterized protein n=1 Tax=Angomonas deanei TaxID=59799 RepID=A0A7G2CH49_9TRYP|nr:hypothetical protein AGDE_13334 [Angomonas deanei]CAD2218224.1 hypothetical protein, conserved [Angomonas deanei]|eukprot:EPY22449.1 hypothetical protein AGDE_13334 [Angomonas deanei]